MTSLYTGETGMQSNSLDLSVIGDNISNANTIGFKESRSAFEDLISQNLIGGGQIGLGSQMEAVQKIITQGALETTGNATDLALQGNGMFVVKGSSDGVDGQYYTRAGQFSIDKSGNLVNLSGLDVQGYAADSTGKVGGNLGNLAIGNATANPNPTANIQVKGNLSSDAVVGTWDPANPSTSSQFQAPLSVYDSLGKEHDVNAYFVNNGGGSWTWHAMTDGGGLQGGTAGVQTEIASGTMTFDTNGKLTASSTTTDNFNPLGATAPQALAFDFSGMTQVSGNSATTFINQDGYAAGTLSGVQVDSQGEIIGAFSNGQSRNLGQVAIANFQAPDQLSRASGNLFTATPGAGDPNIGAASTGGRGSITAGALEQSNVDLAGEFVKMIAAQRGFEANSKTIQTADSLLSELMQLKR
jgi:flagellar hook protein FlgE